MNENIITLRIQNIGWVADFSGPLSHQIESVMGTSKGIATPFTKDSGPSRVWKSITDRNPEWTVRIHPDFI